MKVMKSSNRGKPAYPSLRQFVKGKKWAGAAAIGLGVAAVVSSCARYTKGKMPTEPQPMTTGGVIVSEPALGGLPPMPQPAVTNQQGSTTYVVKKGDTLSSLALRFLGQRGRWREIVAANPVVVPERLKIGQTLVIPAAKGDSGYTR